MTALLRNGRWIAHVVVIAIVSSGCASTPPPEPVKPVTVRVTASDFCPIMRAIRPPSGTLSWAPGDTPETVDGIRAVNAAVRKRCVPTNPRSPTS